MFIIFKRLAGRLKIRNLNRGIYIISLQTDDRFLYSSVIAPGDDDLELLTGNEKPVLLFVNGKKTSMKEVNEIMDKK